MLLFIPTDRLGRAALHGFLAEFNIAFCDGLPVDITVSALVITLEELWRMAAALVAVDAR